jgi:hypothetical protein
LATEAKGLNDAEINSVMIKEFSAGYSVAPPMNYLDINPRKPNIRDRVRHVLDKNYHHDHMYGQFKTLFDNVPMKLYEQKTRFSKSVYVEYLQTWYDEILPFMSSITYDDHLILHSGDIELYISDQFNIDPLKSESARKLSTVCMRPKLHTSMREPLQQSQLTTLTTLVSRNFNAPDITNDFSPEMTARLQT